MFMGETTGIEWCDATYNPWIGCSKVSPGCTNCYAEREMNRYGRKFTVVRRTKDATFYAPLRWKEPKRIFTCSWSDFFHRSADAWREEAWDIMLQTPRHTYMILTKRPGLMVAWAESHPWPDHVWAGTSVENQKYVPRLDVLARVPAKVRFVSVEPMLGPVDISAYLSCPFCCGSGHVEGAAIDEAGASVCFHRHEIIPCPTCRGVPQAVHWAIAGGESGPGARPTHPDWFRQIRDQCEAAEVPFFFKQRGAWTWEDEEDGDTFGVPRNWRELPERYRYLNPDNTLGTGYDGGPGLFVKRVGKSAAGALLDGWEWREMPA